MEKKIRLALIDDDPHLTNLLSEVLSEGGFEVRTINNSSEYNKLINDFSPDLILLDWMMPEKDGIEILTALKNNDGTKDIPVFMVTTKNLLNEVNRLFTAGADDYICKPFNYELIPGQIKDKLEKYHKRRSDSA